MTTEILGSIWLVVAVPLAAIVVGRYAVRGFLRDKQLIALGEAAEKAQWIKDEQERLYKR